MMKKKNTHTHSETRNVVTAVDTLLLLGDDSFLYEQVEATTTITVAVTITAAAVATATATATATTTSITHSSTPPTMLCYYGIKI